MDSSIQLEFSEDTICFDTVFVTMGSATRELIVRNRNSKRIRISDIRLAGGESSIFRMNVDGRPVTEIQDVEIWPEDSLYIFIEVTIDPTIGTLPFIVTDSILFETNDNFQDVDLVAWGQDAHFYGVGTDKGYEICNETWTNDKPYVIYGGLIVDTLCSLNIEAGTRVHLHNDAILYVKGSLNVAGGTDSLSMVSFQGTRLEYGTTGYYQRIPGQWGGIWFLRGSTENRMNGALIRNSVWGVRVDSLPTVGNTNLVLTNTTIRDVLGPAIWGLTANVLAANCVAFNCGGFVLQLDLGGNYGFLNCTFANQPSSYTEHRVPVLRAADNLRFGSDVVACCAPLNANFVNCVVYGTEDEELWFDDYQRTEDERIDVNVRLTNCLLKTKFSADTIAFENPILNPSFMDTIFVSYRERNLRLNGVSPCIDAGLTGVTLGSEMGESISAETDADGLPRDERWDIGAYEF